jgi:hypothetical protein
LLPPEPVGLAKSSELMPEPNELSIDTLMSHLVVMNGGCALPAGNAGCFAARRSAHPGSGSELKDTAHRSESTIPGCRPSACG